MIRFIKLKTKILHRTQIILPIIYFGGKIPSGVSKAKAKRLEQLIMVKVRALSQVVPLLDFENK